MPTHDEMRELAEKLGELGAPPMWVHVDSEDAAGWELETLLNEDEFPGMEINGLVMLVLFGPESDAQNGDVLRIYTFLSIAGKPGELLFIQSLCSQEVWALMVMDSLADADGQSTLMDAAREETYSGCLHYEKGEFSADILLETIRKRVVDMKYRPHHSDNLFADLEAAVILENEPQDAARRIIKNLVRRFTRSDTA